MIAIRWIDSEKLQVHEEFLEFCQIDRTTADHIVEVLKDFFLRFNLKMSKTRAMNFDGARLVYLYYHYIILL